MFPGKKILKNISFELRPGERLVFLGPSGAGKTTLLRLLQRLDDPNSGVISFRGKPYHELDPILLRRTVAYVFQEPEFLPGTVEFNLRIHERLGHRKEPFTEEELAESLRSVNLPPEFLTHDSEKLSTGEKKRVSVARALLGKPEVIMLDEPTANLDPTSAFGLLDTLKNLTDRGLSLLAVMHQVEHARRIASRVIMLIDGEIREKAPAPNFFDSPKTDLARMFLSGEMT